MIYDPGPPDGASIHMTSNQTGEQWNRDSSVNEEFHIPGSHGDAYIILGGTFNDPDAPSIDVGRTRVECRP